MKIESVRDRWMSQTSALQAFTRLEAMTPGTERNHPVLWKAFPPHLYNKHWHLIGMGVMGINWAMENERESFPNTGQCQGVSRPLSRAQPQSSCHNDWGKTAGSWPGSAGWWLEKLSCHQGPSNALLHFSWTRVVFFAWDVGAKRWTFQKLHYTDIWCCLSSGSFGHCF